MRTSSTGFSAVLGLCLLTGAVNAKPTLWEEPGLADSPAARGDAPPHPELVRFLLQGVRDAQQLRGYRVAILAADGVDGFELFITGRFLSDRGALVHLIAPRPAGAGYSRAVPARVSVLNPSGEEDVALADRLVDQVQAREYDAIFVPSNRRQSRAIEQASGTRFLQQALREGIPVYAAGNGALVLLQAGLLDRRRVAADDATVARLAMSGAHASDAAFELDGPIFTTRDAFGMPELIERLVANLLTRPTRLD